MELCVSIFGFPPSLPLSLPPPTHPPIHPLPWVYYMAVKVTIATDDDGNKNDDTTWNVLKVY